MRRGFPVLAAMAAALAALPAGGQNAPATARPAPQSPEELRAAVLALRPAQLVWRAVQWRTCPLQALEEARQQKKPVLAWVFLGNPSEERC